MSHFSFKASGFIALVALGVALLGGCDNKSGFSEGIPEVTYIELVTTPTALETELSGRTTAFMVSEVRPQVGGIILERLFEEGTLVKEGQQLYQIDPALFKANVATAKASLQKAEANARATGLLAQRYRGLVKSNAVSRQEYDNAQAAAQQARAEVAAAKAALETAEINLNYTRVTAPITGIIGKSSVTPGALVTPSQGQPLALVQQPNPMYVDVTQSSTDLLRLKKAVEQAALTPTEVSGAEAVLILPDGTEYSEKGKLLFSDVTVDPSTGSYLTRAIFPNPTGLLLQNLYVRIRVKEAVSQTAIHIPQRSVTRDMKGNPVTYVLVPAVFTEKMPKPNTHNSDVPLYQLEQRTLVLDRAIGNKWVVLDGLKAGDKLVMDGAMKIQQGKPFVTITPYQETPPAQDGAPQPAAQ